MGKYTKDDIKRLVQEEEVKFIRLQFTDILGTIKNVEIPVSQLDKALDNQMMFDGSSIEGFVRIEESDMYLYPDYDTFMIFPWTADGILDLAVAGGLAKKPKEIDIYRPQIQDEGDNE